MTAIGDHRGQVVYTYHDMTGRLIREDYPNCSYVEYTYYGADAPTQRGFVWKVEHKKSDGSLLIGYEYTYDLLGRVVQSVERPSGDTTTYAYTPVGRLESEQRTGQVWHWRSYGYNPDGSRAEVLRDDALNGSHWDIYFYEEALGRLQSVLDVWTGEAHQFVWNPEGTLARWWNGEPNSYARVFSYDEEGRLTKIERDYGNGSLQTAYEYGYTGDGVRVWKRDYLNQQEYRYLCRIGCGGVPMRVYNRAIGGTSWASVEDYLPAGNALGYDRNWRFSYAGGELLMMGATGEPSGYYPTDSNGVWVQSELPAPCVCPVVDPQAPMVCPPLGYGSCEGGCEEVNSVIFLMAFGACIPQIRIPRWVIDLASCLARCKELDDRCRRNANNDYEIAKLQCKAIYSWCIHECMVKFPPSDIRNREICFQKCQAQYDTCLANAAAAYRDALNRCDQLYDTCRDQCYELFPPKKPEPPKNE